MNTLGTPSAIFYNYNQMNSPTTRQQERWDL